MPILENEIPASTFDKTYVPEAPLGSPEIKPLNADMGGFENFGQTEHSKTGLGLEDLSKIQVENTANFDSPIQLVTRKELLDNKRYGLYERGKDLENIYGLNQSWTSQLGNGIVKMAATGIGTFAQGFATIPDTINAIGPGGKTADLSGGPDGYEAHIDNWLKNIEDKFPNYYTRYEKDHPFLAAIPGFAGSANFWGDKFIKNLGFTVGAIGSAVVQDAMVGMATEGLGEVPLLSAQIGKASLYLNKLFTGTNDLEKVLKLGVDLGKTEKQLLTIERLAQASAADRVMSGVRYGMNIYGSSRTEAGVEARDGFRQVKEELTRQYKLGNLGADITPEELDKIERYATDAMNTRFGINMALLSVSNAVQFDNLFKSFGGLSKGLTSGLTKDIQEVGKIGLKEGSLDVFEKKTVTGLPAKIWDFVRPSVPTIFSEGVYEEGGQFAAERGTYDYYTRKYKNPDNPKNKENWDTLNEVIKSTGYGLQQQFGTTEGIENMFIGALTAVFTDSAKGIYDRSKGQGKDARLQTAINSLNEYGLTGILSNKYDNTLNSVGIAKDMEDANANKDVYKYKNLKHDMFFEYVMSRIPSGMHDVTVEQLEMLKGINKEDFEKTFGMNFTKSNKKTVETYVDSLIEKANDIKQTVDSLDGTFKNPFKTVVDPKTDEEQIEKLNHGIFNSWKKDLAYYASVPPDVNSRLASINEDLMKINPLLDNDTLAKVTNRDSLLELAKSYDERADQLDESITKYTKPIDKKNIKNQIKDLRTRSEKINLGVFNEKLDSQLFSSILNFELNGQDATKDDVVPFVKMAELAQYSTDVNKLNKLKKTASDQFEALSQEKGFEKYFLQAKKISESEAPELVTEKKPEETPEEEVPTYEFKNTAGEKEGIDTNRDYELPSAKTAKIEPSGKQFRVTAPDGTSKLYPSKKEAEEAKAEMDEDLADLSKVKVIALNPDGTIKVEDRAGNIQNISPAKLEGYTRIQTEQEKLGKNKEDIDTQQAEIEVKSGTVATGEPVDIEDVKEDKKPDASIVFPSSTTESETLNDPSNSAPHVKRGRVFLNNSKNFKNKKGESLQLFAFLVTANQQDALGLNGIAQLSLGMEGVAAKDITGIATMEDGVILQVYVENASDGIFYIDEKGERIGKLGEPVDINKVVFQTMRTTSKEYNAYDKKTGQTKLVPRWRNGQEQQFLAGLESWKLKRQELLDATPDTLKKTLYKFKVSRGIARIAPNNEKSHVEDVLVPKELISTQVGLIKVSDDGNIQHQGENVTIKSGPPILQYKDTLQLLNNQMFLKEQATAIYQVIKALCKEIKDKSDANQKVILNPNYISFLQNVLFYSTKRVATNSIYIDTTNMTISLAGTKYPISDIANQQAAMVSQLEKAWHNVNRESLKDDVFSKPFTTYKYNAGTDELTPITWDNYQSYLLSSTYPDGSARSIASTPVVTRVEKPTPGLPYSFEQKYSTLQAFEMPAPPVVKKEKKQKTTPPPTSGYEFGKPHEFETSKGNLIYTATVTDAANNVTAVIDTTLESNNNIINAFTYVNGKPTTLVDDAIKFLKENDRSIEGTPEDLVKQYLENAIGGGIKKEEDARRAAAVVEPVLEEEEEAPSDIEAEKADIKRKKQEELKLLERLKASLNNQKNANDIGTSLSDYNAGINREIKKIEDKIAKYDEELAKLEEGKQPPSFNDADVNNDDEEIYSRLGKKDYKKERITEEDIEFFKKYLNEVGTNIPYEVLLHVLKTHDGGRAWGAFERGVLKFFKSAPRGTEYHELFEVIYNSFLTDSERQELLDEFKAKKGTFVDRQTGEKVYYAEATDNQAKEQIADDFGDYRVGKLPARSFGEKILNFFKNIINFFKEFVTKPSKKTELFKAIDKGKFKNYTISDEVKKRAAEYSRIPGITETQAFQFVQDMTIASVQTMFGKDKENYYNLLKITGNEVYEGVKANYIKRNIYNQIGEDTFNQLFGRTKELLSTLGINFNEEDVVDKNDANTNQVTYAPEAFTTDWKKTSPFIVKILCATLPQTVDTNQDNRTSMKLPTLKTSTSGKGGVYLLNSFSRVFATTLDRLSNTTNPERMAEKLFELAMDDPNYMRLYARIGGDVASQTGAFSFDKFDKYDWRLFINFYQTFSKQRPNSVIEYISGDKVYTAPADQFTAVKNTMNKWFNNMKVLSNDKDSIIKWNKDSKMYKIGDLKDFPINNPEQMISFLEKLGIEFSMDAYLKLKDISKKGKTSEQDQFAEAVSTIRSFSKTDKEIGTLSSDLLEVNQAFTTLARLLVKVTNPNQENTHNNPGGKRVQSYTTNNAYSVFANEFNEAETNKQLKGNLKELNDPFSTHSVVLGNGGLFFDSKGNRIKDLEVSNIEGNNNENTGKGTSTSKLKEGDRYAQEINQNLKGNFYILLPGDSATEWMENLGNYITFDDVQSGNWDKIYKVFNGYLLDDIALALDYKNRQKLKNVGKRAKELRFFKDILSDLDDKGKLVPTTLLTSIDDMISKNDTKENIEAFINKEENSKKINEAVKQWIEGTVQNTRNKLTTTNKIIDADNGNYKYQSLDSDFANQKRTNKINKNELSDADVNDILTFAGVNHIISGIEFHKIHFGDPYQFADKNGKLDEPKRIKSFGSGRNITFNHAALNSTYNDQYNKADGIELTENDPGYHKFNSFVKTVTFEDVLRGNILYDEINEADAASYIMDGAYREMKIKNGQWPDEAEAWHQWQMAYTRQKLPGYNYTNSALEQHDKELIATDEPEYVTEVLKPTITGVKNDKTFIDLVHDKTSQMPLYFKSVERKALGKVYAKIFNQKIGYAIYQSGRKEGIEGMHKLYVGGKINEEPFAANTIIDVPWKIDGIQVENSYSKPKDVTLLSQTTKVSSIDMFDQGVPTSPEAKTQFDRHNTALNALHEHGLEMLFQSLGIEDIGGGNFSMENKEALAFTIQAELMRRQLSQNAKDTIKLNKEKQFIIPFEASSSYKEIQDIVYSMIQKALISPKMNGGAYVQAPVTGWENIEEGRRLAIKQKDEDGNTIGYKEISEADYNELTPIKKADVILTSDTLKFYEDEDGKRHCEVMIPHWFRGMFKGKTDAQILAYLNSTPEGQEILRGVGARIPTQSMSSIEVFVVKEFLPKSMGYTVIVPSEITAKSGSDFDVDKLNMYLKNVYVDEKGDVRLVRWKGSKEATKEFYNDVFTKTIQRQIDEIEDKNEFRNSLLNVISKLDEHPAISVTSPKSYLTVEEYKFYSKHIPLIFEITDQAEQQEISRSEYLENQLTEAGERKDELFVKLLSESMREKYVNNMYKKSLQNEYYDALDKMVSLPENFERLVAPVTVKQLKKDAKELNELKGISESGIKNRILDRNYMTTLRDKLQLGKDWVGRFAISVTGHSLFQKAGIYLDPERVKRASKADQRILGNLKIVLPHNTDANGNIALGRVKTANKSGSSEYISERLSTLASGSMDVANDSSLMDIISHDLAVNTFVFLERAGCGDNTKFFMNQPIILAYLSYLDNTGAKSLYTKSNIDAVNDLFPASKQEILNTTIDVKELKNNIKNYAKNGKLSSEDNAVQQEILKEFLKYSKMADYCFKMTQATNYDTSKFRSGAGFSRKKTKTDMAQDNNIFSSVDRLLDSSSIGKQKEYIDLAVASMGEIFKLDQLVYREITGEVMYPYATNDYLSEDDFETTAIKLKTSFLDYIVLTKSPIGLQLANLTLGENSVANQLEKLKQKYGGSVQIINALEVRSGKRKDGAQTVALIANTKEAYDKDIYTEMMRELKEIEPEFYDDLVKLSIIQGTYQSAVSIKDIIPVEDRAQYISQIINTLSPSPEVQAFATNGAFQKNNWGDNVIVPEFTPRFTYATENGLPGKFDIIPHTNEEIYQYIAKSFPNTEFGQSKDRRILEIPITDTYNSKYDVIKVRRIVIKPSGEKIDFLTGKTVADSVYGRRVGKGDLSLYDVFGYQRVTYDNGDPLITSKGNFIYKQINLLGDGQYASEYYAESGKQSIYDNGSVKVDELNNNDIINSYDSAYTEYQDPLTDMFDKITNEAPVIVKERQEAAPTQPSTSVEEKAAPTQAVSTPSVIDNNIKDIINESSLEKSEYSILLVNGKQTFVDIRKIPNKLFKDSIKFYSSRVPGGLIEQYGKKLVVPGFEDINLAIDQKGNVYELSTGMLISLNEKSESGKIQELKKLFTEKDIRKVISTSKKIDANNIGTVITSLSTEAVSADRKIKVEQFDITVKPDGRMIYQNGKEVTDQTTKNKVNVRKELQDGTLRVSIYNNAKYFVLSDNRIVGSGSSNVGKESVTNPIIKEAILAKAITYKKTC